MQPYLCATCQTLVNNPVIDKNQDHHLRHSDLMDAAGADGYICVHIWTHYREE